MNQILFASSYMIVDYLRFFLRHSRVSLLLIPVLITILLNTILLRTFVSPLPIGDWIETESPTSAEMDRFTASRGTLSICTVKLRMATELTCGGLNQTTQSIVRLVLGSTVTVDRLTIPVSQYNALSTYFILTIST